jgi:hypothetical protein
VIQKKRSIYLEVTASVIVKKKSLYEHVSYWMVIEMEVFESPDQTPLDFFCGVG